MLSIALGYMFLLSIKETICLKEVGRNSTGVQQWDSSVTIVFRCILNSNSLVSNLSHEGLELFIGLTVMALREVENLHRCCDNVFNPGEYTLTAVKDDVEMPL